MAAWRREREKRLTAEEEVLALRKQVLKLKRTAARNEKTLASLRNEIVSLTRNAYRSLGKLYLTHLTVHSDKMLILQLEEMARDFDGTPEGRKRLAAFLDRHMEQAVSSLRSRLPRLSEDDIALFCYLAVRFDTPLIAELMKIDAGLVYTRKNRMIGKILRLGPARSRRYLELIE